MPRKSGSKANAKGAIADGSLVLNSTAAAAGPTRGGSTTRGAKRRRTSNNVNSNSTEIYGSGTIVAANPFDDDLHMSPALASAAAATTTTSKMMILPQPPMHQHQPTTQIHPIYSPPATYMQQPQQPPMSIPPHHHHHHQQHQQLHHHPHSHHPHTVSPSGQVQMPGPTMQDHHGPIGQPQHPHQALMHQGPPGGHMIGGPPPHQGFGPPPPQHHPHPPHANQTQMIGTSTPPHMMGPAPSISPYMQPQQMLGPPQQAMTPQPPNIDHMNMMQQQQPYPINHNVYCGKCQREVYQNEPNIICKAGCMSCFHISCSGLSSLACDLLMKEAHAEWACDRCATGIRRVPFVKFKT